MNMRDPLLYRIRHAAHHRTGDRWCIYPMYDFAHALSDAIEGITHSLCTLEFEDHRRAVRLVRRRRWAPGPPQQIEFARLNLNYTVMSKRKLLELVNDGQVTGWDDPRMPTLAGLRRRGVHARGDPRTSATRSASPRPTASIDDRHCSSTRSARTSTCGRPA